MADSPNILDRVLIAKLQFCQDDTCQLYSHLTGYLDVNHLSSDLDIDHLSNDLHLQIDCREVELSKSLAIAVSYTWGEFGRRDVLIGHNDRGKPVSMNLGREWDIQEAIVRLAELCIENGEQQGPEHAGLWIDQLCIPQTNAEIRKTLASIPNIYRTLDVVALMPGGVCSCFQWFTYLFTLPQFGSAMLIDGIPAPIVSSSMSVLQCSNVFGLSSYFDRVWTRQELFYSRSVRIVRTARGEIDCVGPSKIANTSTFASRLYTKHLLRGLAHGEAYGHVVLANGAFLTNVMSAIVHFQDSSEQGQTNSTRDQKRLLVDFLSGRKITRRVIDGSELDIFLLNLTKLGKSTRKATKARDYVTSVWVDCPGYILPIRYKEMCLPSLLEDAIQQLEANHGVTIQVSALVGLLGQSCYQPGLWRPMTYLGRRRIEDVAQVYRTILRDQPIPVTLSGEIPLIVLSPTQVAISQLAMEYSEYFKLVGSVMDVLDALRPIFQNFSVDIHTLCNHSLATDLLFSEKGYAIGLSASTFLGKLIQDSTPLILTEESPRVEYSHEEFEDLDHHQLIYRLVAISLGLDPRDCQSRGLKLVVVVNYCIGLVTPEVLEGGHQVITVSTSRYLDRWDEHLDENTEVMLEATKVADEPLPRYRAAGIWVPHGRREVFPACAYIEPEYPNGFLG
jgi:hypothetical protein